MQRICLLLGVLCTLAVPGLATAQDTVDPVPLQLSLQLEADDALLDSDAARANATADQPQPRPAVRGAVNRSGSGYQVRAVIPSLCEDGLPGGQVVDTYNRVMDCEDDTVGVSISIRNY
ncbi:hypothetical protein HC341_00130 [Aquisalimonas sp. 2447]|uniref:hypothetical protein n=1 Tax=Aquisalimonas sp. 2447 TaxID=2740807 RepID=UPI0014325EE0|nr:hypothetical protein [Aquisalimonas sp. 2447]QIT53762.1 hypothetical protein HC341_00130 [Aquisalimonas sp. 2447]